MATNFKDEISPAAVESLAEAFARAWPGFPRERFVALASDGLSERELTSRIDHVADALVAVMPADFATAVDVIVRVLASGTLDGWISLSVNSYVAKAGVEHPHLALGVMPGLTERFSCEFAVRPFIERHPEVTMQQLHAWIDHPSEHVRRLVSEGSRPRLPWAPVLRGFVADPTPTIELLDRLFDDPSEYVRRSVANHLNDISKDHPAVAVSVAERWSPRSTHGEFVVRHGLRTLVKRGHPGALALRGFDTSHEVHLASLTCEPATVAIGDAVTFTFTLVAERDTSAVIDYLVHYQGARGHKAGKVFKLTERQLAARQPVTIDRTVRFEHVSIRRIAPGPHRIEVQVNGRVLGGVEIEVVEAAR